MIKVIIRRFLELIITCALFSAIAVVFNITGLCTTRISVFVVAFLGALLWFYLNVSMLRHCYFDLRDRKAYYFANFIDFNVIFLLVSMMILVLIATKSGVFTWMANELLALSKYTAK